MFGSSLASWVFLKPKVTIFSQEARVLSFLLMVAALALSTDYIRTQDKHIYLLNPNKY